MLIISQKIQNGCVLRHNSIVHKCSLCYLKSYTTDFLISSNNLNFFNLEHLFRQFYELVKVLNSLKLGSVHFTLIPAPVSLSLVQFDLATSAATAACSRAARFFLDTAIAAACFFFFLGHQL